MDNERKIKKPIKPMIKEKKSKAMPNGIPAEKERQPSSGKRASFLQLLFGAFLSWRILLISVFFIYMVVALISQQAKVGKLKQAKTELLAIQEELINTISIKNDEADYVGSDAYIEWSAREKFGWVKGDEIIFREENTGE